MIPDAQKCVNGLIVKRIGDNEKRYLIILLTTAYEFPILFGASKIYLNGVLIWSLFVGNIFTVCNMHQLVICIHPKISSDAFNCEQCRNKPDITCLHNCQSNIL